MLKQKSNNFSEKASIERDFTMQGILRDPVYLSKEEEDMYVQKDSAVEIDIDFTDPNGEDAWKGYVVSMDSWKYYADNADKDKYGLIANSNEGGPHVALAVKGGKFGLVEVSYVLSYENFGKPMFVQQIKCRVCTIPILNHKLVVVAAFVNGSLQRPCSCLDRQQKRKYKRKRVHYCIE